MTIRSTFKKVLEHTEVLGTRKDVVAIIAAMDQMNRDVRSKAPRRSWHVHVTLPRSNATTSVIRKWYVAPFFVLASCSLIDPHNMIGRQMGEVTGVPTQVVPPPPSAKLDTAARMKAFDFVWNTINERYYDPSFHGADWRAVGDRYRPLALAAPDDEAFWDVLDRM